MPQVLYYCYEKATGLFAGSGTPLIDDATHGCTTTPVLPEEGETWRWTGTAWEKID